MADDEIDYGAFTSYDEGEAQTHGFVGNVKVYSGQGFYVTTRLSDIPGSRITEDENPDTGETERGIFIPFKNSGVTVTTKKNVQITCAMDLAQVASSRHTHLLRQIMDKTTEAHWRGLGFKQGFCGFASPKGYRKKGYKQNER